MKIARNIVIRPTPIALPGRSIHLGKQWDEAPLSDLEAAEGTVAGLVRSKAIKVRDATPQDHADYPDFSETPNKEFEVVQRKRANIAKARLRAAGANV